MTREARSLMPRVVRKHVPGYKKSGSVSAFDLTEHAPTIRKLYDDRTFLALLEGIAGVSLLRCPDTDPHALALYHYSQPGDGIGFHYDSSLYKGARYTVLIGLVNESQSELVCHPYRKKGGPEVELRLATQPGTLVLFNGDNIWHAVSPLVAEGEERIVLTFEYVTDASMTPVRRLLSNFKDAATYFGFRHMLGSSKKRANAKR
jgi:hypothetical protein